MKIENDVARKLFQSLFALLFGVMFTLGGLLAGVLPMTQHIHGWWRSQNLVVVQADVVALELKTYVGEGTTHQVLAEFGYDFNGTHYRSTRIGAFDNGSDNIDDYHQLLFQQLQTAKAQERKVPLWVDPQHPDYAVFDPHVRWMKVIFLLPFAILFPAVGLGSLWVLWTIWRKPDESKPARAAVMAGPRVIKAEASLSLFFFLAAGFWNLIAWPIAILFLNKETIADSPFILLVALFPLVGLVLIYAAAKVWLARRRIGNPVLRVARLPYIGMQDFAAQIRLVPALGERLFSPKSHYDLELECRCTHLDRAGETMTETILWSCAKSYPQLPHGTRVIDMVFDLRGNLPPSGRSPDADSEIVWRLILKVFDGEVEFVLPVSAA